MGTCMKKNFLIISNSNTYVLTFSVKISQADGKWIKFLISSKLYLIKVLKKIKIVSDLKELK